MNELLADSYYTIESTTEGLYREKGSKFVAYAIPVQKIEQINTELAALKKLHPKSRHVCYSYKLGIGEDRYRINDDGEPSGSAGLPIYNEITSFGYSDVLVAVVRYFGGTKLGIPGLIQAYKTSSREALSQAIQKDVILTNKVSISCPINEIGSLYNVIKTLELDIIGTEYSNTHSIFQINIRQSEYNLKLVRIVALFEHIDEEAVLSDWSNSSLTLIESSI